MTNKRLPLALTVLMLAGCSNTPSGRYSIDSDVAPNTPISVEHIEDAHPQREAYSLGGNKDYTLGGKQYHIIKNPQGFTQTGKASWYGSKFHGHRTSNGEVYDMYSMTAAHKTLPLPSYVKVTNTDNGKAAIVRVNDRGPFHTGRIIDLSYAAASKLGVLKTGTANVRLDVITPSVAKHKKAAKYAHKYYIQLSSSRNEKNARTLAKNMSQKLSVRSFIDSKTGSYRVFLGPFVDYTLMQDTLTRVKSLGHKTAFVKKYINTP